MRPCLRANQRVRISWADSGLDRGYASIHSSIVLIHRLHFEATNYRAYFDVFNSTSLTAQQAKDVLAPI
jgi:hypothetical protein